LVLVLVLVEDVSKCIIKSTIILLSLSTTSCDLQQVYATTTTTILVLIRMITIWS